MLRISRTMFLRMLDSYPEAAQRLRELIAARADQWAREMENVRATLGPQYRAALLVSQLLLCRRCSISRLTSRASNVAG